MLNQSLAGLEFSFMVTISVDATKGRMPKTRLINLYFPVVCIDHLKMGSKH